MGLAAYAGLTCGAPRGRRRSHRFIKRSPVVVTPYPYRIIFVRHGETSYNAESRLQGQRDIPLDDKGREQASAAGRALRGALAGRTGAARRGRRLLRFAAHTHA